MTWPPFQNETYGDGEHVEKIWRFCQPCLVFAQIWPEETALIGEKGGNITLIGEEPLEL